MIVSTQPPVIIVTANGISGNRAIAISAEIAANISSAASASASAASASASAAAAALYDGPKVDTFPEIAAVTAAQVAVGGFLRVVKTGAVYERAADAAVDADLNYSGTGGVKWYLQAGTQGKPANGFSSSPLASGSYPNGTTATGYRQYGAETSYSGYIINGDNVDQEAIAGSKVNGFKVLHNFGGGKGGRHGIYGVLNQTAISAATATDRNYVGVQGQVLSAVGDGGTAPTFADGKGSYFGLSSIASLSSGALNLLNVTGAELNTRVLTGASAAYISGAQIVTKDEVQGGVYDCALAISRGGVGTIGKKDGILIGNMNGSPALDTTGNLMRGVGAQTLGILLDFRDWAPTWLIRSDKLDLSRTVLDMRGLNPVVNLGLGTEVSTPSLTFKSSVNGNAYDSRIIASGGGVGVGLGNLNYNADIHAFSGIVRPTTDNTLLLGGAANRWAQVHANQVHLGPASDRIIRSGTGSPEGAITAPPGSIHLRTDGGAGTTFYVKETGVGNTGWVAK